MITQRNIQAEKQNFSSGKKIKYLLDNDYFFVEEFARKTYEKESLFSVWTENNYWWEIYVLLFWDIIFAKIDGVVTFERKDRSRKQVSVYPEV